MRLTGPPKLFFEIPKVDNQRAEFLTQKQLTKVLVTEEPDQDAAKKFAGRLKRTVRRNFGPAGIAPAGRIKMGVITVRLGGAA